MRHLSILFYARLLELPQVPAEVVSRALLRRARTFESLGRIEEEVADCLARPPRRQGPIRLPGKRSLQSEVAHPAPIQGSAQRLSQLGRWGHVRTGQFRHLQGNHQEVDPTP